MSKKLTRKQAMKLPIRNIVDSWTISGDGYIDHINIIAKYKGQQYEFHIPRRRVVDNISVDVSGDYE